jgi:hypothetical protein
MLNKLNFLRPLPLLALLVLNSGGFAVSPAFGESPAADRPFLPTWKLLAPEEKRQFIAGYLYGLADAQKVMHIAQEFVRDNPKQALGSLESLASIYDMGGLSPDQIAKALDIYFNEADHSAASLSQAVTAAKARLR